MIAKISQMRQTVWVCVMNAGKILFFSFIISILGYNSTTKCHKNQFPCSNGQCIDLTAVCDGMNDCEDGEDELKCHDKQAMKNVCHSNMFACTSGQCIPAQWLCDEFPDCTDSSDEHNCRKYRFWLPNFFIKSFNNSIGLSFKCSQRKKPVRKAT